MKKAIYQWSWVVLFAVAFAWVESAVVVYLREIYYNGDFFFPLNFKWEESLINPDPLILIETGREAATLIMLFSVGWVAGDRRVEKFSYFMIAFGVWDIFYYIWLYVMIRWPDGLMTWDILFFIPLPWVGPVITPVLIAMAMVVMGSLLVFYSAKDVFFSWRWYDAVVEIICCILMVTAFCWDWKNIMQMPADPKNTGIPNPFAWWLYLPPFIAAVSYFTARVIQMNGKKESILPA